MKWISYCTTCHTLLANQKTMDESPVSSNMVEKFAFHHLKGNADHVVIMGYQIEDPDIEIEVKIVKGGLEYG